MSKREVGYLVFSGFIVFTVLQIWFYSRHTASELEKLRGDLISFKADINRFKSLTENRSNIADQYTPTNLWIMERRLQDIESELETLLAVGTVINVVDRRDRMPKEPPTNEKPRTADDARLLDDSSKWVEKNYVLKRWLPIQNEEIKAKMSESEQQLEGKRYGAKEYEQLMDLIPRRLVGSENSIDFPLPSEVVQRRFVRAKAFEPRRQHDEVSKQ